MLYRTLPFIAKLIDVERMVPLQSSDYFRTLGLVIKSARPILSIVIMFPLNTQITNQYCEVRCLFLLNCLMIRFGE
jgi:hypothetical protein